MGNQKIQMGHGQSEEMEEAQARLVVPGQRLQQRWRRQMRSLSCSALSCANWSTGLACSLSPFRSHVLRHICYARALMRARTTCVTDCVDRLCSWRAGVQSASR